MFAHRLAARSWPGTAAPARQLGSVAWRYHHPLGGQWRGPRNAARCDPLSGRRPHPPQPTAVGRDARLAQLEAVLFLASEPLHARKLSTYANLADGTEARTLVSRLNQLYDHSGRAFRVEQVAGGWQLRTRAKFARWLRRLPHVPPEIRLSPPAMETLAVIAYRQPVVRADVEAIRGVSCGEILRQLMERGLVRISGRSDELGRPYCYSTTKWFLEVFGLNDLEQLPRADLFAADHTHRPAPAGAVCGQHRTGDDIVTATTTNGRPAADGLPAVDEPILRADEDDEEWEEEEEEEEEYDEEDEEEEDDEDYEEDDWEEEDEGVEEEGEEEAEWEEVDDEELDYEEDEDDADWEEEDEDWEEVNDDDDDEYEDEEEGAWEEDEE